MTEPFYAWEDAEVTDLIALAERLDEPLGAMFDDGQYVAILAVGYNNLLRERKEAAAALREAHAELQDTTWQDHADAWQKRAVKAEAEVERLRALLRRVRKETYVADLGIELAEAIDAELGDRHD